jgi:hypothetical protein
MPREQRSRRIDRQRAGALDGAVDEMHALDAAVEQAEHTARDEPPAPSTSASSHLSHPGARASRLLMKPSTSVLVEHSSPFSNHSVLAAPTARRAHPASTAQAPAPCAEW